MGGYAETDGPLGAYFLAQAFKRIGYTPVIISPFCEAYFDIKTIISRFSEFGRRCLPKTLSSTIVPRY